MANSFVERRMFVKLVSDSRDLERLLLGTGTFENCLVVLSLLKEPLELKKKKRSSLVRCARACTVESKRVG